MIKLFGRMVPALARGMRGDRLHPTQSLTTPFRVLPHDIDANRHLNNGRYLQLVDVARAEWLLRIGVADVLMRRRWKPVLGATSIQFRRELTLWDRAMVTTRLLGWDQRWVFLEHRIDMASGRPAAIALAKAGFRRRGAWVPVDELIDLLPYDIMPPALPASVAAWCALEAELSADMGVRQLGIGRTRTNSTPEAAQAA